MTGVPRRAVVIFAGSPGIADCALVASFGRERRRKTPSTRGDRLELRLDLVSSVIVTHVPVPPD
jgi:hypothetical protein